MNKHLLFVHISKTAGTSFRLAAEEYFGRNNIFYDYSPDAPETSREILDFVYTKKDIFGFYETMIQKDHSFLSGHFPTKKYSYLYDALNIVSFMREPVSRTISLYNHYKYYNGYKKDLVDFIADPKFRNLQSAFLKERPLSLFGFIGITEQYQDSIEMFNMQYQTNIACKHLNTKKEGSLDMEELDPEIIKMITGFNAEDIACYNNAISLFEIRKDLFKKGLPYTYGTIQKNTKNHIVGIAFQKEHNHPIELDIYRGDTFEATIVAQNIRPGYIQHNVPRKGYVGFDYHSKNHNKVEMPMRVIVKNTKQEII